MKREMRTELRVGLLLVALGMLGKQVELIPHVITAALLGAGIALELIGMLSEDKYQRLKQTKRRLLQR